MIKFHKCKASREDTDQKARRHFQMRSCWCGAQGGRGATVEGSDIPVVPEVIGDAGADQKVPLEPRRSACLRLEKSELETGSKGPEVTMAAVREEMFAFCDGLVFERVHFITLGGIAYYASSLLLERACCPENSVLLICTSVYGEKVVVKFTCDAELAGRELEVGRRLCERGLHVPVAGSKRAKLKGFEYEVGYSVTRLMRHGDLSNFLSERSEDVFDVDRDVSEAAQRELLGRCLEVGRDVIPQLKLVHRCGWLHCDVKPNNILVGEEGGRVCYKVHDWDHAVKLKDAEAGAPVAGTECYEGPEVGSGGRIGRKLDVFGLGATLFYVCAGAAPVFKDGQLLGRPSLLPDGLWKLLLDMMQADPEERPELDECLIRLEAMKDELQ